MRVSFSWFAPYIQSVLGFLVCDGLGSRGYPPCNRLFWFVNMISAGWQPKRHLAELPFVSDIVNRSERVPSEVIPAETERAGSRGHDHRHFLPHAISHNQRVCEKINHFPLVRPSLPMYLLSVRYFISLLVVAIDSPRLDAIPALVMLGFLIKESPIWSPIHLSL